MAMACLGEMPSLSQVSRNMRRFSAPSQMSPHSWSTIRPVSWPQLGPDSISSTFERVKSMPSRSRTRSVKKVKPPETSSVFRPAAWQALTSASAPGLSSSRSTYTCSRSAIVTPRSIRTRRRRLSL